MHKKEEMKNNNHNTQMNILEDYSSSRRNFSIREDKTTKIKIQKQYRIEQASTDICTVQNRKWS